MKILFVIVLFAFLQTAILAAISDVSLAAEPNKIVAMKVAAPPKLDGDGSDSVWQKAQPLTITAKGVMPKTLGTSTQVTLRVIYTDTSTFMLAIWDDATQDDKGHKTWKWDADKKAYAEDGDREDMFGVAFEHTGEFTANMLSPVDATWDVWHWKAFRTNRQGYAMDKTHRFTKTQPPGKANKHTATDSSELWICPSSRPAALQTCKPKAPGPTANGR